MEKLAEVKEYPFEFSVVMAVYNVELFLREAVDSLIGQDFGFEHIQLIMVDDGSTDGSGAICDEYAEQYPENIMVIHKENGGVASARNAGLEYIRGKYINFLDSDDKLDIRTLSAVHSFFENHYAETDVVAIPIMFFDGQNGEHPLNYKFNKGSRVIDLYKEWSMIQFSMSSAFVKKEVLNGKQFEEQLAYAEDARLLNEILLDKFSIGVLKVKYACYLYRKRTIGEASAIQKSENLYAWYIPYLQFFCYGLIQAVQRKYDFIPKFIQFTLAYDLQWRVRLEEIPTGILTEDEEKEFRELLYGLFQYIDDNIILKLKRIFIEHRLFIFEKKYQSLPRMVAHCNDVTLAYNNIDIYSLANCKLYLEFLNVFEDSCVLEGCLITFPQVFQSVEIKVKIDNEYILCTPFERKKEKYSLGEPILKYYGFRIEIQLERQKEKYSIKFFSVINGYEVENRSIVYGKYFPVSKTYTNSYYFSAGWKTSLYKNQVIITSCGKKGFVKSEIAFLKELWKKNKTGARKAVLARIIKYLLQLFKKKEIWLICDKADRADDNGEAFFVYLQKIKPQNIKSYFLIGKDSLDYQRMKKIGKVIPYMSWRHKMLYLVADFVISAYSHDEINNPFLGYHEAYRDMLQKCKYIFLQHGIIKDDLSLGTNRYHKNIKVFVCSTIPERDSIVNNLAYGYSDDEVILTGLPRYDRLYDLAENAIVIMPTWRRDLFGSYHREDSRWDLKPGFEDSVYYKFYQALLCNERLLEAAKVLNFQINFVPHPVLFPYVDRFDLPSQIKLWGSEVVYRDMFAKSKLLVTDFSSVAFDFAYLRKPLVYTHFDVNHYQEGYFDYERDGFGEVEYSLESTIDRIIDYMKNGCQLKDKYRERIDKFFVFNDQNNSQRVYESILALSKQEN